LENRVDGFEGVVYFFTNLRTSQDDLATNKDKKNDLGLDHSVDETREQFRLVGAEVVMARSKTFQANGELDIAGADNVLDFEVRKLCVEAEFLNDTSILS